MKGVIQMRNQNRTHHVVDYIKKLLTKLNDNKVYETELFMASNDYQPYDQFANYTK
jgi:hypothetical protein